MKTPYEAPVLMRVGTFRALTRMGCGRWYDGRGLRF
jgi:hypothetical protein